MPSSKRKQIEKWFGISLPETIRESDIELHQDQPDPAWKPHTVYIRIHTAPQTYETLVQALALEPIENSDYRFLLPGKWKLPQVLTLDWWTPTLETPPNTAARAFGDKEGAGWILAKYENGYAYLRSYNGT
jgi:hypothetical protein